MVHEGHVTADSHNHQSCTGEVADKCFFHYFHQVENDAAGRFVRSQGLDVEYEGKCQHDESGEHQYSLRVEFPVKIDGSEGGHYNTE